MGTERLGTGVLEVTTDSTKFRRGLEDVKKNADGLQANFTKLGQMLAGAFSVTAIVSFAKETIKFADEMDEMATQTGIGVERLQALNYILTPAGISINDLASAVGQLSRRLIGDDKAAVQALERLGLNAKALINLDPDLAFGQIAEAVAKIPNPMERSALMMDLFGRSGTKYLKVITEDFNKLADDVQKNGPIISESQVADLARFSDEWDRAAISLKVFGANLLTLKGIVEPLRGANNTLRSLFLDSSDTADAFGESMLMLEKKSGALKTGGVEPLTMSMSEMNDIAKELDKELKQKMVKSHEEAQKKVEESAKAYRLLISEMKNAQGVAEQEAYVMAFTASVTSDKTKKLQDLTYEAGVYSAEQFRMIQNESTLTDVLFESTNQTKQHTAAMEGTVGQMIVAQEESYVWRSQMHELGQSFVDFAQVSGESMSQTLRGIGQMIVGLELGHKGVESLTDGFKRLGQGSTLSGLASIVGGIGGIVSAASAAVSVIRSLWDGLKNLFGGGEEGTQVNPRRDQFFNQYGGYEGLAEKLTAATDGNVAEELIRRLYDAENMEDYRRAAEEIVGHIGGQVFKEGGLVMRPTIGLVGEAGPEAVVPLHKLGSVISGSEAYASLEKKFDELKAVIIRQNKDIPFLLTNSMKAAGAFSR